MRNIVLGLLLAVVAGLLPVFAAHAPVDVGAYNSVISVKEDDTAIIAEVKVQNREGNPYNIKKYSIDRGQETITLLENRLYNEAGVLKATDKKRMKWTYSQNQISAQALHDSIYEAVIKWADEEKKDKKKK